MYEFFVDSPFRNRTFLWQSLVTQHIEALYERREIDPDKFLTFYIEASQSALATHVEEKWQILVESVVSATLPENDDDFHSMQYLRYVCELEPESVLLLERLTRGNYDSRTDESLSEGMDFDHPDAIQIAFEALLSRGLVLATGGDLYTPRQSQRGRQFLSWLRSGRQAMAEVR